MPAQQEEEAGDDPLVQCIGQQEAPLILEMVTEEEVTMRDEGGGRKDPTNGLRSLQRRKTLVRKNTEKLKKTK